MPKKRKNKDKPVLQVYVDDQVYEFDDPVIIKMHADMQRDQAREFARGHEIGLSHGFKDARRQFLDFFDEQSLESSIELKALYNRLVTAEPTYADDPLTAEIDRLRRGVGMILTAVGDPSFDRVALGALAAGIMIGEDFGLFKSLHFDEDEHGPA